NLVAAAVPEIAPGVARDSFQPATKAAARVVHKSSHFIGQLKQDGLRNVLRVGLFEGPLPAPTLNLSAVALGELPPGRLVYGYLLKSSQEGGARLHFHGGSPSFVAMRMHGLVFSGAMQTEASAKQTADFPTSRLTVGAPVKNQRPLH